MKKTTILFSFVLCLTFFFTGCGAGGGSKTPSYFASEEEIAEAVANMETTLESCNVSIDGKIYDLPVKIQAFYDDGWAFDAEILTKVDPFPARTRQMDNLQIYKTEGENEKELTIALLNLSTEDLPIEEVDVSSVSFSRYEKIKLILPQGITWASTIEDVEAAYGATEYKSELGNEYLSQTVLQYRYDKLLIAFKFEAEGEEEVQKLIGISYHWNY